ncbi:MAG TPA: response regulator [Herpetosiphonaceae bacterium]
MSFTNQTPCRVLVVEDDESIVEMVQMLLEMSGYAVIAAEDGVAAVQHLHVASALPHVILLDLQMPRMDGRTFLAAQRSNPQWSAIPVIILSASYDTNVVQQELDVQASICKPFDPARLLDLVAHFCP